MAFDHMTSLQFTRHTCGGFPAFVTEFRQIVLDLEDAKQPMNAIFQKTMFLSKVKDRDYDHIKDTCMEDKGLSITDTIAKMESKWKSLHAHGKHTTNHPPMPRQVNLLR